MARRRTRRRRGGSICVATANKAHQEALKKCGKALEMAKKSSGVASKYLSAAKAKSPVTKSYTPGKIGSLKGKWNPSAKSAKSAGRRRRRRTKRRRRSRSRSRGRKSRRRRRRKSRRRRR